MINIIWPLLVAIGMAEVLFIDVGRALDSPWFWLIPVGVAGGTLATAKNRHYRLAAAILGVWLLVLIGINHITGLEYFIGLDWIVPTAIFSFIGLGLLIASVFVNKPGSS